MKALTFLLLCFASVALADDFKTIEGKEYKNVTVTRVEPDGIVITFSGGIVKLPFVELSPEVQNKYGYDPKAAEEFQQQTYQGDVLRSRQLTEAREKRQKELEEQVRSQPQPAPAPQTIASKPKRSDNSPFSQVEPTDRLQGIPNLTVVQYEDEKYSLVGRIVHVQFSERSSDHNQGRDGTYKSWLWYGSSSMRVRFQPEQLGWFTSITPAFDHSRPAFLSGVYGKVVKDDNGTIALDLLGTQIRRDMSGRPTLGW